MVAVKAKDQAFTPQLRNGYSARSRITKIDQKMNAQKKRSLEREINNRLYRNLTREGIRMDHLDPTKEQNWPLLHYPKNKADYINLLPPSYRNPFQGQEHKEKTRTDTQPLLVTQHKKNAGLDFKQSLAAEWSITDKPKPSTNRLHTSAMNVVPLLVTVAGILFLFLWC